MFNVSGVVRKLTTHIHCFFNTHPLSVPYLWDLSTFYSTYSRRVIGGNHVWLFLITSDVLFIPLYTFGGKVCRRFNRIDKQK
jgi:hypothetical protein